MTQETAHNSNKEKATTLLDKIFNSWVKVSYDQEKDIQYRKPLTKEQMDNSQNLLNKVKKIKCDDEWVKERTNELQNVVNYQNKREYKGKKVIPILLIIYSLFYILPIISSFNPEIALGKSQEETTKRVLFLNKFIVTQENKIANIKNNQGKSANLSDKEKEKRIAKSQKLIDIYNKKIEKYLNVSDESLKSKKVVEGFGMIIFGLIFFLTGISYKKAFSPPQFLRDFREKKAEEDKEKSKPLPKFITTMGAVGTVLVGVYYKFIKLLVKQEGTFKVRTTYSSGSTKDETILNPLPIIGAAIAVGTAITVLAYMAIFSPVIVVYNYLKNYVWYK